MQTSSQPGLYKKELCKFPFVKSGHFYFMVYIGSKMQNFVVQVSDYFLDIMYLGLFQ